MKKPNNTSDGVNNSNKTNALSNEENIAELPNETIQALAPNLQMHGNEVSSPEEFNLSSLALFRTPNEEVKINTTEKLSNAERDTIRKKYSNGAYSISLEASAGTGKTTTIVSIVLLALLRDVPLSAIVAITYTKVGAAEMRSRVRLALKTMLQLLSHTISALQTSTAVNDDGSFPTTIAEFVKLIEKTPNLPVIKKNFPTLFTLLPHCHHIGLQHSYDIFLKSYSNLTKSYFCTLHSFAENICNHYSYATGNYGQQKVLEDSENSEIFIKLIKKEWQKFYTAEPSSTKKKFSFNTSPSENIFYAAITNFSSIARPVHNETKHTTKEENKKEKSKREIEKFECHIKNYSDFKKIILNVCKAWRACVYSPPANHERLKEQCALLQQKYNEAKQKGNPACETFFLKNGPEVNSLLNAKIARLANNISKIAKTQREENATQNFNDLLDNLAKLASDYAMQKNFSKQFKLLIIDEAQDCNQLQFEILQHIFYKPFQTIVVVGDAKQSIFGFQGANVEAYINFVKKSHKRYYLSTNYRSSPELIESFNCIYNFAQKIRSSNNSKEKDSKSNTSTSGAFFSNSLNYLAVKPSTTSIEKLYASSTGNQPSSKNSSPSKNANSLEDFTFYTFDIANNNQKKKISQLALEKACFLAVKKSTANALEKETVAILVPNNTHVEDVSTTLQKWNVQHEVVNKSKTNNALHSPAASIVLALLGAVLSLTRGGENHIRTLLTSPFFRITRKNLLTTFPLLCETELKPYIEKLDHIFRYIGVENCLHMALKWKLPKTFYTLENIDVEKKNILDDYEANVGNKWWAGKSAAEILLSNDEGDVMLAVYVQIATILGKLERQEKSSNTKTDSETLLSFYISQIEEWKKNNVETAMGEYIKKPKTAQQKNNFSITVMNYHNAKGLEFHHVILPFFNVVNRQKQVLVSAHQFLPKSTDAHSNDTTENFNSPNEYRLTNSNAVNENFLQKCLSYGIVNLKHLPAHLQLDQQIEHEERAESARKLYVALTRAKKSLAVFMFSGVGNKLTRSQFKCNPQFGLFVPQLEGNHKADYNRFLNENINAWRKEFSHGLLKKHHVKNASHIAENFLKHVHSPLKDLEEDSLTWNEQLNDVQRNYYHASAKQNAILHEEPQPRTLPSLNPISSSGYIESFTSLKRTFLQTRLATVDTTYALPPPPSLGGEVLLGEESKDYDAEDDREPPLDPKDINEEKLAQNLAEGERHNENSTNNISTEENFKTLNTELSLKLNNTESSPSEAALQNLELQKKFPFTDLPRGKTRGTLLHQLLKIYPLHTIPTIAHHDPQLIKATNTLLQAHGLNPKFRASVSALVQRAVHLPISVPAPLSSNTEDIKHTTFTLASLSKNSILKEETFFFHLKAPLDVLLDASNNFLMYDDGNTNISPSLPKFEKVDKEKKTQKRSKISSLMSSNFNHDVLTVNFKMPKTLEKKNGHIKGEIDAIFCHENRYYLLDWKSNELQGINATNQNVKLKQEMLKEGYNLQYYLYLLALHRFLKDRVKNYSYEKHFGGVLYFFLAVLDKTPANLVYKNCGIFFDKPREQQLQLFEKRLEGMA